MNQNLINKLYHNEAAYDLWCKVDGLKILVENYIVQGEDYQVRESLKQTALDQIEVIKGLL